MTRPGPNRNGKVMEKPKTVADLKEGEEGVVVQVGGSVQLRTRLLEMGLARGARVRLVGKAPLGDPLEIKVRGASLAIRREEAKRVRIDSVAAASTGKAKS